MIFASYAQFYAKGRRPFYIGCFNFYAFRQLGTARRRRAAVDCKSALTAPSSDATWLLISLYRGGTPISRMMSKILGG